MASLPSHDTGPRASTLFAPPAWMLTNKHFLLDLDGTLIREETPIDGAGELLAQLGSRCVVVSNNSTDTATSLARRLLRAGLRIDPRRLVLAGQATIDFLAERHPEARVLLIASPTLRAYARARGCALVDDAPDTIVLALDKRFDYAKLHAAANYLRRGARLIVTNPDASHPAPDDALTPETGALMNALVHCAGVAPALVVGKPEAMLFTEGLRRLGGRAIDTLVIGDNPDTDAAGAVRLGMRYLLVGGHEQADAPTPARLLDVPHAGHARLPGKTAGAGT